MGQLKSLGVTPMDVAKSISEGFARNVISAFNGTTVETTTSLTADGSLILYTWNEKEKSFYSTSHVMAQVLEQMYPESN
jgi:threonyl-tRNA synthetase